MSAQVIHIPVEEDLLQRLAELLLTGRGGERNDLADDLVLLPSSRAGKRLGRILLRESGAGAVLLPRVLTPEQWADGVAPGLGHSCGELIDDRVRAVLLAHRLLGAPWLADRPENAPALAAELLAFFDEARRHRRDGMLLDGQSIEPVLAFAAPQEAEPVAADLDRAREAWRLYREAVPVDRVDFQAAVAGALTTIREKDASPPGRRYRRVFAVGFSRIDPLRAELLRAALTAGDESFLLLASGRSKLSRLFLATWSAGAGEAIDPLAPSRRTERLVIGMPQDDSPAPADRTLRERLAAIGDGGDLPTPAGPLELLPCGDPETEARAVVDRVASLLDTSAEAPPRIGIAVNDPQLAARITTQLADAGIDADNTHGKPLAVQPAGLLVRYILRAALTDLRAEALLEVLTHPYVQLAAGEGGHGRWTLQLEQMFRRDASVEGGLAALRRRAKDRDEAAADLFGEQGPGLAGFVDGIEAAFAPLIAVVARGAGPWRTYLDALAEVWRALAAERPLAAEADRSDIRAAAALIADLRRESDRLPHSSPAEFAADLGRLLAGENVAAHRARGLPVWVTGLVEARLERFDHLILAGMREGVFPSRTRRPLLLPGRVRRGLGLPVWQESAGRDAELFLRLLHNAPHVLITWPVEDAGRPVLPSPLVSRLILSLGEPETTCSSAPLWRREPAPRARITADQAAFEQETADPALSAEARPITRLSWSALRVWRDCPYRFLLERRYALRKPEEVQAEFGRKEYGRLVHEILRRWLDPAGPGTAALTAGDEDAAGARLKELTAEVLLPGSKELPARKLWHDAFLGVVPALVRAEIARFADWRPLALEAGFELSVPRLAAWIGEQAAALDLATGLAAIPDLPADLPAHSAELRLTGVIDRLDRSCDGTNSLAVIDYKTGRVPSAKSVKELEELQVLLYAAAVEAGALVGGDHDPGVGRVVEGRYYPLGGDQAGRPGKPQLDAGTDDGRRLLVAGAAEVVRLALDAADPRHECPLIPRERAGEGPAALPCRYCDFRGVCRLEERSHLAPATVRKLDKLIAATEGFFS